MELGRGMPQGDGVHMEGGVPARLSKEYEGIGGGAKEDEDPGALYERDEDDGL